MDDRSGEIDQRGWEVFVDFFRLVQGKVHTNAKLKGWWTEDRNDGEALALIHSEVSECLEALRDGNPPDKHLPTFSSAEVELADVVIRIMDLAHARRWDVAGAIAAKHQFNQQRARKHGRLF